MSIERIESMESSLMNCVESQMADLKSVDTHELGEAIDMIKDLAEAAYYRTITEAMKEKKENNESNEVRNYYTERVIMPSTNDSWGEKYYPYPPIRYAGPDTHGNMGGGHVSFYEDGMNPRMTGTSPTSRKMYMEAKDMHKGSAVQMQELEHYMTDLSKDITDMINDASAEEKLLLQQKLITLANKIKPNSNVSN